MNGQDYTEENENTAFTFIGTGSLFIYWPYIIAALLVLLALLFLVLFVSAELEKVSIPVSENVPKPGRKERPSKQHVLRDDYGFYRTRGYFQNRQGSPSSGRGSINPAGSMLNDPQRRSQRISNMGRGSNYGY